ncbi:MAG: RelA/SpoT family protein [Chitinophagales bacterium]|nr:bifunctional (p)ppGpp synthetase/guanosine-3',5'-bis(diphosphate) 3'-pyrophosphohydrolase [Chitinophagales bacterium]MCO5280672.1 RelA/SpoT family protein [Chitinophagales bacterium]OJV30870.1 MAG: RelA/SpoT family protein [Bacteroidetes bacterium 37-13]HRP39208.1 RelA/SpoT family protein [Chitinophagales bacterium]
MSEIEATEQEEADKKIILKHYRSLLRSLKKNYTIADRKHIRQAFELALDAHKEMRRKSGEPYILHPIAVAQIASEEMGLDATSVVCALLHDVVEDTDVTLEEIERSFNKEVAKIVDGLTKISGISDLNSSIQAENFRKLLLTLNDDIRVILVKLADRLHNMRTLDSLKREKQLKIVSETVYLYAPLAHRMGLYAIKTEMEDLALKHKEPEIYKEIAQKLAETKRERNKFINDFIRPVKEELEKRNFNFNITGRPKSIFSIYNKIKFKGVPFEEIYDLFAIRVIVHAPPEKEKSECWGIYSTITDIYRPNPERLRDWLSNPKANGYEALHTTVMSSSGKWVEIQIRTDRMHEIAERGFAAHWKYKEAVAGNDKEANSDNALDEWLEKISNVLGNPDSNALDLVNDFKTELISDEIFVFTPKGDLKRLRKGATSLDFAFEIHSEIGKKCIGAKVNHKLVPLSHVLKNGDQIEILTSNKQQPNEDWLSYVVTAKARSVIKQSLKDEQRKIAVHGKELLEKKLKQLKIEDSEATLILLMNHFKALSSLEFYYNIATKKTNLEELNNMEIIAGKIKLPRPVEKESYSFDDTLKQTLQKNAELLIMGESSDKIDYKFATCCNPVPGDDVFGFITVSEGIKIHRTNCPNAVQLMAKYSYRVVKTRWTKLHQIAFLTGIKINGIDDVGLVNKITDIITGQLNLNMRSLSFDSSDGIFEGKIMVYVHDTTELEDLIDRLKALDGVLDVERIDEETK